MHSVKEGLTLKVSFASGSFLGGNLTFIISGQVLVYVFGGRGVRDGVY